MRCSPAMSCLETEGDTHLRTGYPASCAVGAGSAAPSRNGTPRKRLPRVVSLSRPGSRLLFKSTRCLRSRCRAAQPPRSRHRLSRSALSQDKRGPPAGNRPDAIPQGKIRQKNHRREVREVGSALRARQGAFSESVLPSISVRSVSLW